jgi:porin
MVKRMLSISFSLTLSFTLIGQVKDSASLSGYKSEKLSLNPNNKDMEMEIQDRKAPYYRLDVKVSQPWFDWKKRLNDNTGIKLSFNYTSQFLGATSVIQDGMQQTAFSGIFDATINWNFINRKKDKNKGSLIFWVDSRHLYYGETPPHFLNFNAGSALLPALKFNKWTFRTLEFYYQQQLFNGRAGLVVGKIDMPDWFTYHGLLHPMMHFSDLGFSVNPTVNWSNPGFGIVAGGWLDKKKRFGIQAGLNDVAGDNLNSPNFLDMGTTGWENGKFLKMVEFMYAPTSNPYFSRIGLTYWHSDELLADEGSWFQTPSSQGFTVQGTWFIKEKYIPIVTFGLSDGMGANALTKLNLSLMHGWYFQNHDMFAIGLNYTESTISGRGQYLSEIFYRLTVSKALVITPSVKMVLNPALDSERTFLGYYGVRTRISL